MDKNTIINNLMTFLDVSPTCYQAVQYSAEMLEYNGYVKLDKKDNWNLEANGKYYIVNNDSALIAFRIGSTDTDSLKFHLIGSHSDSPTFRVKPSSEMPVKDSYIKLNTEVYGGPILSTWFDRPLSIAGRVFLRGSNPYEPILKLINIDRNLMIIPNLAIHMNREINSGYSYNAQVDTLPLLSMINENLEKENILINLLSEELGISKDDILDFDLYLYAREKAALVGLNKEFISSGRLDNLAMAHASLTALIDSGESESTNVVIITDNEEVGSMTRQGADSPMIADTLMRITLSLTGDIEDYFKALSRSFMISSDMAHALHPNHPEKSDPTVYPVINGGPVIKIAASKSYTSDAYSISVYKEICKNAGVPVQEFTNRSDSRGGSTIGPITSKHLDIASVDIGNPTLSMHSVRELAGVDDHYYVYKSFLEFYS